MKRKSIHSTQAEEERVLNQRESLREGRPVLGTRWQRHTHRPKLVYSYFNAWRTAAIYGGRERPASYARERARVPSDPSKPEDDLPFTWPLCGTNQYVAIHVKRPGGNWYRAPFYRCFGCSVMFEQPRKFAQQRSEFAIRTRSAKRLHRIRLAPTRRSSCTFAPYSAPRAMPVLIR
jgi:hypothetical protein